VRVDNVRILRRQQIDSTLEDAGAAPASMRTQDSLLETVDVEVPGYTAAGTTLRLHRTMLVTTSAAALYPAVKEFLQLPSSATHLEFVYPETASIIVPTSDGGPDATQSEELGWQDLEMENGTPTKYDVGLQVIVHPEGPGILRYVGDANGQLCAGVELVKGNDGHTGTVHGVQYFRCKDGHGVLAPVHRVTVHGVRSRARAVHSFITMSREDTQRLPSRSRASSIASVASRISSTQESSSLLCARERAVSRARSITAGVGTRADTVNAPAAAAAPAPPEVPREREATIALENKISTQVTEVDFIPGLESVDANSDACLVTPAQESCSGREALTAAYRASMPHATTVTDVGERAGTSQPLGSAIDVLLRDGGLIAFGEDGQCVCCLVLSCNKQDRTRHAHELPVELDFVVPRTMPLGPLPMVSMHPGNPLSVPGFRRYFVLPRTKGFALGYLVLQSDDGKCDAVCLMRCHLEQTTALLDAANDEVEHSKGRGDCGGDELPSESRQSASVDVVLEKAPKLCKEFIQLFSFGGVDTTYMSLVEGRRRMTFGYSHDDATLFEKAVAITARVHGKMMTLYSSDAANAGEMIVQFQVARQPRAADCLLLDVGGKRRGCINLLAVGSMFETPRGQISPNILKLWCSPTDFLDWRRAFSIRLGVFEENKYSIFRDASSIMVSDSKTTSSTTAAMQLGSGAFGSVTKRDLAGIAYAVKEIVLDKDSPAFTFDLLQSFLEAQVLLALRSPCLIPLNSLTWSIGPRSLTIYMVMDYAHGGNLRHYLYDEVLDGIKYACIPKPRLDNLVLLRVWREFFSGLKYLHEKHGLIHRDLKPENVVVVRDLTRLNYSELRARRDEGGPGTIVRIVDFGQATFGQASFGTGLSSAGDEIPSSKSAQVIVDFRSHGRGTNGYQAPEMLFDDEMLSYTTQADVWSATLLVWEMWSCRRVFIADNEAFQRVSKLKEHIVAGGTPDLADFPPFLAATLRYGCTYDPQKRPTSTTLFEMFYHLETSLDWSMEPSMERETARNDGDEWVVMAAERLYSRAAQLHRVDLPYLFVASVDRLADIIRRVFRDDFCARFLAYLHISTTSPTFLLPSGEHQRFLSLLHHMLVRAREQPRLHIKVAWEYYGPIIVKRVKTFLGSPNAEAYKSPVDKESGACIAELDAILTLLACFSEFSTSAARAHFLSHDFAEELLGLLRQTMVEPWCKSMSFWAKVMVVQVLGCFVSSQHTPIFYTGRSDNCRLVHTMADMAFCAAESLVATMPGVLTEGSELNHKLLLMGVVQILHCCTCLCSTGPLDSRLSMHGALESCDMLDAVVLVLQEPAWVKENDHDVILQCARLLAVWPCHHRGALVALCYWMLMIPFDMKSRTHGGDTVVSFNRAHSVGTQLHPTLFESILAQLAVTPDGSGLIRLLTAPLLSAWGSVNPSGAPWWSKSICSEAMQLHDFHALLGAAIICDDDAEWKPACLWLFSNSCDGAEVVATLLDLTCQGYLANAITHQVVWSACYTVHQMTVELESHWKAADVPSPQVFMSNPSVFRVAQIAFELLPTLTNLAEGWSGKGNSAMLGHMNAPDLAYQVLHRLLGAPCNIAMTSIDCFMLLDFLMEELCLLTADAFSSGPSRLSNDALLESFQSVFKSLMLLVCSLSPVRFVALKRLKEDLTFIEVVAELLKATRRGMPSVSTGTTKEAEGERKKRLTWLSGELCPYVSAFLWQSEICTSLFQARGMNVFTIISPMTEIVDLYDVNAGLYPPNDAFGIDGDKNWFSTAFKMPSPSCGQLCFVVANLCKVAMEDTFWAKSMISVMVATGHNYPRGRVKIWCTPSNFNILIHLESMLCSLDPTLPTTSATAKHACTAVLALWELTTACYVPKESFQQLDSLTFTLLKVFFLSAHSREIEWTSSHRLDAIISLSQILKRFWRQNYTLEVECVRLVGNWLCEFMSTSKLLVVNAAQFLQNFTWMLANPGVPSDDRSLKEETNRKKKIAARKKLMAQWPYRVLDFVADTHGDNEHIMLCVHDAHESLLKVPPVEWPRSSAYPPWRAFESEQRFKRLTERITINVPPVEYVRLGPLLPHNAIPVLTEAIRSHHETDGTLAHVALFGECIEATREETTAFACQLSELPSLSTVQLCRFMFRGTRKAGVIQKEGICFPLELTVALLKTGKRVELCQCSFSDKASAELHGKVQAILSPGTLSLGTSGAALVLDAFSRDTMTSKGAAYISAVAEP